MDWSFDVGSGIAGVATAYGAHRANKANIKYGREAAGTQMTFQERMSNTSYQRSMADMRKAGLNPLLAYSQGGSSTPSGSAFVPQHQNVAGSALDIRMQQAQLATMKQNLDIHSFEAEVNRAKADLISPVTNAISSKAPKRIEGSWSSAKEAAVSPFKRWEPPKRPAPRFDFKDKG